MQLSRAGEYGVLGLLHMARRAPGQTVMLEEVSRQERIPKSFLGKIFQNLARAGLVKSYRGAGGGFALLKRPEEITVLHILEAVDGPIALQRCQGRIPACHMIPVCPLCGVLAEAQDRLRDVFQRTTLSDLMNSKTGRHRVRPGPTAERREHAATRQ